LTWRRDRADILDVVESAAHPTVKLSPESTVIVGGVWVGEGEEVFDRFALMCCSLFVAEHPAG